MSDFAGFSDAQLMALLRPAEARAAQAGPAATGAASPLGRMSDAELMRALAAQPQTAAGADFGAQTDEPDADASPAGSVGASAPSAAPGPGDPMPQPLPQATTFARAASPVLGARTGGTRGATASGPISHAGVAGRPAMARAAQHPGRPLDPRLAGLRRLLLSGPAMLPLVRSRQPPR